MEAAGTDQSCFNAHRRHPNVLTASLKVVSFRVFLGRVGSVLGAALDLRSSLWFGNRRFMVSGAFGVFGLDGRILELG